jgi:aldose 1-epimerase
MNFSIERYVENGFTLVRLKDKAAETYVSIMPSCGALLHEFVVHPEGEPVNIIDNYQSLDELAGYHALWYKGAKLSPFVCRVRNGAWHDGDTRYEFSHRFKDGSAIHGLLYNKSFNITDEFADDNMAAISLRYHYKREDIGYPFDYVCEVRYILQPGNVLQLETTITNLDDSVIPLVDGWHPYFSLGGTVDDYILRFASVSILEFDETLIPTGKILDEPSFQVAHRLGVREIDNCYIVNSSDGMPVCVVHNPANKLTLSFYAADSYPYLQVFTPQHRQSIAIENLSGAPDSFNNGIGLIKLEPRRSHTFNAWYRLDWEK